MLSRQNKNYIVGIYARLSRDDERAGESLSIENQKLMLKRYVEEQGWAIHDVYVDDGISGTTFDRPQVQRLLDDAKAGIINLIIVKDLSRFGRNYIEIGQYIDYIFPLYGIRFIALQDNVDTANNESGGMDMMPIMNVFNEWHAANTSKKIRAVKKVNAKNGKYNSSKAPYGYVIGTDEKRLPVIDEPAASIVRRIFELRSKGISRGKIAEVLNDEGVQTPAAYCWDKFGYVTNTRTYGLWTAQTIANIVKNPTYRGDMAQLKETTVSYKNHKRIVKDESEFIIVPNTHEAIVDRELWFKVKEIEASVSHGKRNKEGEIKPLSGLMYCADCNGKMRQLRIVQKGRISYSFDCGNHKRFGKYFCFSHHVSERRIEEIILADIKEKANKILADENAIRKAYLERITKISEEAGKSIQSELRRKRARITEIERLLINVYEDKVNGKIPEDLCVKLINKYQDEQKVLQEELKELERNAEEGRKAEADVDEFIRRIKNYYNEAALTRETCMQLIDRVIIGGLPKITGKPRVIQIVYKVDIGSVL